jgi:hypothetical protein
VYQLNPGLKKGTTPAAEKNKNILDEMNINKAREIQIVSNPFSLFACFVPVQ